MKVLSRWAGVGWWGPAPFLRRPSRFPLHVGTGLVMTAAWLGGTKPESTAQPFSHHCSSPPGRT